MSPAATFPIGNQENRPEQPNYILKTARQSKVTEDTHHMPSPRRHDGDDEFNLRESMHIVALSSTQTSEAVKSLVVQVQTLAEALPKNGSQKWTGWIQTGVICAMLLVSGTDRFKSSEAGLQNQISDLKSSIAVLSERLSQSDDRQRERERIADRDRALINEQNRQISIQLEARGIRMPKQ
jgi:hypothetical protein